MAELSWDNNGDSQPARDQALADVTNAMAKTSLEQRGAPQAHGWTMPQKIDYSGLHDPAALTYLSRQKYFAKKDDNGDFVADEALEKSLFDPSARPEKGLYMYVYDNVEIKVQANQNPGEIGLMARADDQRLHPLLRRNLEKLGWTHLMPVQAYVAPYALEGYDIMAIAQTGSGKTAAYLLPILTKILANDGKLLQKKPNPINFDAKTDKVQAQPVVLIVVPTRELAIQVAETLNALTYRTPIRFCSVYGGPQRSMNLAELAYGCDVLIGTPGRLKDLVTCCPHALSLSRVRFTVMDEADELVQDDWTEQIEALFKQTDVNGAYFMFSATFEKESRQLARNYLSDKRMTLVVGRCGRTIRNIHQILIWVDYDKKREAVRDLLSSLPAVKTIVFCNTQGCVDMLDDYLYNQEFPCSALHGKRTQREREEAISRFKSAELPILVTTSIAARGLDFAEVKHVINYDLPSTEHGGITDYVHRIGRTARLGNLGQATSFYNEHNEDIGPDLARLLIEMEHSLPDFLTDFAPADGEALYEEENLKEEDEFDPTEAPNNMPVTVGNDDGWGSTEPEQTQEQAVGGWGAADAGNNDGWV